MSKSDQRLLLAIAIVVVAGIALSDPGCKGGCRYVAEHAFKHGVNALFA
jgi:hypothetical protein